MLVTEKISFKHQMAQSSLDGYLQTYLLVEPARVDFTGFSFFVAFIFFSTIHNFPLYKEEATLASIIRNVDVRRVNRCRWERK